MRDVSHPIKAMGAFLISTTATAAPATAKVSGRDIRLAQGPQAKGEMWVRVVERWTEACCRNDPIAAQRLLEIAEFWCPNAGKLRMVFLALLLALSACASGPRLVDHAFGFDARVDSPETLILDFRYGTSGMPGTTAETGIRQIGRSPQVTGINGPQPLGDTLYVKWQDKPSGRIYEDTVSLKPLLPFNMERKRIYFVVQGAQLRVFLMEESVPRPADWPRLGPRAFQYEKTYQIYPTRLPK